MAALSDAGGRPAAAAAVLLFGGSFDPPHHGHLIVAHFAAEALAVARVILIPGASPPHKQGVRLAPPVDRLAMCRLAVADDPLFEVSDFELEQRGPTYTILTVEHYRRLLPPATPLYWLVGADSLRELGSWHRAPELVDRCTIVTVARPDHATADLSPLRTTFSEAQIEKLHRHVLASPVIDISATNLRARVRAGRSIHYLVPEPVQRYIAERGLYRT